MNKSDLNWMGLDTFKWFVGVVEDRIDPMKLGRIRVRVLGDHTDDTNLIPPEELFWAYPLMPLTSAAMNGIGESPLGVVPGTHVLGFYRDSINSQDPIIMGSLPGIPEEPTQKPKGFYDPRDNSELEETLAIAPVKIQTRIYHTDGSGVSLTPESIAKNFPKETNPLGGVLNEPDTNRLARAEKISDTIVQLKKDTRDLDVPISYEGTWSEPATTYDADYPFNHVSESESGHIREVDDTPGAERTHDWNRSGSFREIDATGTEVVKVVGDRYTIIMKHDEVHVMNDVDETFDKEYNLLVGGRWNVQVNGNVNLFVKGNIYQYCKGDTNISSDGDINIGSGGTISLKASDNIVLDAPEIGLNAGQKVDILAGLTIVEQAPHVGINASVKADILGGVQVSVQGGTELGLLSGGQVDIVSPLWNHPILSSVPAASPATPGPATPGSGETPEKPKQ